MGRRGVQKAKLIGTRMPPSGLTVLRGGRTLSLGPVTHSQRQAPPGKCPVPEDRVGVAIGRARRWAAQPPKGSSGPVSEHQGRSLEQQPDRFLNTQVNGI